MEAFEQVVALTLEAEQLIVSGPHRFPVRRQTRRADREEFQTHGYEVDIVGARGDRLVLATVKSYFGSRGVDAASVSGADPRFAGGYRLLNDPAIRDGVLAGACERFGYPPAQVEFRLYVGKFAGSDEARVRAWCSTQRIGAGPIGLFGPDEIVPILLRLEGGNSYQDNPVLATLRVLSRSLAMRSRPDFPHRPRGLS